MILDSFLKILTHEDKLIGEFFHEINLSILKISLGTLPIGAQLICAP